MMLTRNTSKLRQQVAEHVAADQVVQGNYWDAETRRGCFIGCLAYSDDPLIAERDFGLPIMVQRIAESIFEALPSLEAPAFFEALPDAVACDGKDLSRVGWQFLAAELRSLPEMPADIQAVIDPVISGMDLLASGQPWPAAEAARAAARASRASRAAAWGAARASRAAAGAAARAAAWDAAWDAGVAARNAADAAIAATWAAGAAAAAVCRQRDLLLRLISEAPVVGVGQ